MKHKKELETTTNRWVFNRLYKEANAGCSYCKWHTNDNSTNKHYGGWTEGKKTWFKKGLTYPSWKLCSKNRKQWMKKPITIVPSEKHDGWVTIVIDGLDKGNRIWR
jgi:hypothetical protein